VKISVKIRLKPTPEQETLFWKSAGTARWAYNFYLSEKEKAYKEYIDSGKTKSTYVSEMDVRKYINNVLKKTTHTWLKEVSSNVMKQAVKDADRAYKNYFKGIVGKPRFKAKHRSTPSFYVNYESLKRKQNGFQGEKLGIVKTSEPLPKLKESEKYSNPHISFDGKYWYLSVGIETPEVKATLTEASLGIDLGIKELAVCSNGKAYKNINKSKTIKRLKKKLKRAQRSSSRMLLKNTKEYVKDKNGNNHPVWTRALKECRNFQKKKKEIKQLNRRLTNIRNNHIHQATSEIVKTKPSRIVMETLNIKGMMKNRHLSKAIAEQKLYEFQRQIEYKSALHGIEVVKADKWYPSSKKCSCCGHIKKDLRLSDRTYRCSECGLVIDRDYNASINLSRYNVV